MKHRCSVCCILQCTIFRLAIHWEDLTSCHHEWTKTNEDDCLRDKITSWHVSKIYHILRVAVMDSLIHDGDGSVHING